VSLSVDAGGGNDSVTGSQAALANGKPVNLSDSASSAADLLTLNASDFSGTSSFGNEGGSVASMRWARDSTRSTLPWGPAPTM